MNTNNQKGNKPGQIKPSVSQDHPKQQPKGDPKRPTGKH